MTNRNTHRCPTCGYDLTYLSPAEDLTCPECGGRCLGAEAREAARPGRRLGTIVDVLMFLFTGPPVIGAGLFVLGLIPVMVLSTASAVPPWVFVVLSPLMLLWYAVSMSRRLWPRRGALRQTEHKESVLRTLIAFSVLLNVGWAMVLGYTLLLFAGLAMM